MYKSQDALLIGWLTEAERMGQLIESLSQSLLLLANKRATLEEKMIAAQFGGIAAALSALLSRLFAMLNEGKQKEYQDAFGALRETNLKLQSVIDDFLKIARYDLNFLEQYYEHDFCKRLHEDHRFLDVLSWIEIRFQPHL
jgi:hypothetical protein